MKLNHGFLFIFREQLQYVKNKKEFEKKLPKDKTYTPAALTRKWTQFEKFLVDFPSAEKKVQVPRNKRGHPLSNISQVSMQEFEDDLQRLKTSETRMVTDNDIYMFTKMARYAGVNELSSRDENTVRYSQCTSYASPICR